MSAKPTMAGADTSALTAHDRSNIHRGMGIRRRMNFLNRASSLHSALGSSTAAQGRQCAAIAIELSRSRSSEENDGGKQNGKVLRPDDVEALSPLEYRSDSSGDGDTFAHDGDGETMDSLESSARASSSNTIHEEASYPPAAPTSDLRNAGRRPPVRPFLDTRSLPSNSGNSDYPSPKSPASSKSWYEFDLAVVVALVSPIGNWLTGGDHVKNLLLVVLLLFYLHQIIEIPWSLYQKARPRTRGLPVSPSLSDHPEARHAHLAATELRRLEFFFLFLTLASPFLGALLLQYGTAAVLGPEAISWFSTGLFVLSTGMRPWRHLANRLQTRTTELHDFIHYPEHCLEGMHMREANKRRERRHRSEMEELEKHIEKIEQALKKVKSGAIRTQQEMVEYADLAMSNAIRNQDRHWEKVEGRVKGLEHVVQDLQARGIRSRRNDKTTLATLLYQLKDLIVDALINTLELGTKAAHPSIRQASSQKRRRLSVTDPSFNLPQDSPLETIHEVDDEVGHGSTGYLDDEPLVSPTTTTAKGPKAVHSLRQHHRPSYASYASTYAQTLVVLPLALTSTICAWAVSVMTMPLRAATRLARS